MWNRRITAALKPTATTQGVGKKVQGDGLPAIAAGVRLHEVLPLPAVLEGSPSHFPHRLPDVDLF